MKNMIRKLTVCLAALALSACGQMATTSSGSASSAIPGDVAGAGGSLKLMQAGTTSQLSSLNAYVVNMAGGWHQGCVNFGDGTSADIMITLASNSAYQETKSYSAINCVSANMIQDEVQHMQFASLGTVTSAGYAANYLQKVLIWVTQKPMTLDATAALHSQCGGGTFTIGTTYDISNCTEYSAQINVSDTSAYFYTDGTILRVGNATYGLASPGGSFYFTRN